jgi:predicted cation transporter
MVSDDLFGATRTTEGRLMVAASWLASAFISAIVMLAVAELIKLLMDIERNTRAAAHGPAVMASSAVGAGATVPGDGAALPSAGGRVATLIEGEETAEGALLRGH